MTIFIYLHGFASSPEGKKARYLRQLFHQSGIQLSVPDLNQGDFFNLTLTRQLNFLELEYIQAGWTSELDPTNPAKTSYPIALIGSSFGGLTAMLLAQQTLQVNRLVLLAPALQFDRHLSRWLGVEKMQQWETNGFLLFPHYGEHRDLPLSYQFWTDLVHYENRDLSRQLPTLIVHGIHDEVIPIQSSREFAAKHPWVELQELDSDHGLGNVIPEIWQSIQTFCSI